MTVLVVGATGQVGSEIVRQLAARGEAVRAFARPDSRHEHLRALSGVELVFGDLLQPASLPPAVAGVEAVIATANGVAPRRRRDVGRVETVGYPALLVAAARADVEHFVYLSSVPLSEPVPGDGYKRAVEAAVTASGLHYTIIQFTAFMDVWLALPGSSIPLQGLSPTLFDRPFWFLRLYRRMTGRLIERFGRMIVVGAPEARTAFIAVHDVAALLIAALDRDEARDALLQIGGPEALSWHDVAALYAELLGREVRITALPPALFRALGRATAPFSPAAGNILALNHAFAGTDLSMTGNEQATALGVGALQRAKAFLEARMRDDPGSGAFTGRA